MKTNFLLKKTIIIFLFIAPNFLFAQLGVNADNSAPSTNAMLDVKSSAKGVLIPRVGADLASPTEGLLYYNTTGHNFRYYDGTAWQNALFGNQWNVNGTSISYSLGSVGIGTNTPASPLDFFHPTNASMYFHNNFSGTTATDGLLVGINSTSAKAFFWNYENAALALGTNNLERLTITSSGNVGIGFTGASYKLSVNGDIYSNGVYINGFSEIVGTLQANTTANFLSTVNVSGTLNANGNLAVDGNITTNTGKGIVRSEDATQMVIEDFATPANIDWTSVAGNLSPAINLAFSTTFTSPPSIAFGRITGMTNPENIIITIESITNTGAVVHLKNVGSTTSVAMGARIYAMVIGKK
jgi:hypothetical protein